MKAWKAGIAAALAFALVLPAGAGAEGIRVGVIDVNRILNESEAGKTARKTMEGIYEGLRKKLEAKQEDAKKLKEDLDKEKILVDKKEKLKAKEELLAAKVNELRQMTQDSEKEMQTRQRDLERGILASIESTINKVVESEKIDVLLDRAQGGVLYYRPEYDITAKVLDLVNKGTPASAAEKVPEAGKGAEKGNRGGK